MRDANPARLPSMRSRDRGRQDDRVGDYGMVCFGRQVLGNEVGDAGGRTCCRR